MAKNFVLQPAPGDAPDPGSLMDLQVLALDAQATSGRPETGHLLELGWVQTKAADLIPLPDLERKAQAHLIRPPEDVHLPSRTLEITGISAEELKHAPGVECVWERLSEAAEMTARNGSLATCPTVIHFGRYEERFLRRLHGDWGGGNPFPFKIVCTHRIIQRLYPGLPRKGLRTVSGFFGFSLPALRRSRHHAAATALIWRHLVHILLKKHGPADLPELLSWLAQTASEGGLKKAQRFYPMEKRLREGLPDRPGLYRMYRLNGDILYVGKAKSIRQRVNSYFRPQGRHSEHMLDMLSQAKDLTVTPTRTALEAAIRESDEIKRLAPPFNRALQIHGRRIMFASLDLDSRIHPKPDREHPLGPLASPRSIASLGSLLDILSGGARKINRRCIAQALDISPPTLPDRAIFMEGVRNFQAEHQTDFTQGGRYAYVMRMGARFWRQKLEEKSIRAAAETENHEERNASANGEETAAAEYAPGTWDADRVGRVIKSIIRIGAWLLRRATWYVRLSEAVAAWSDRDNPQIRHVIEITEGKVLFAETISVHEKMPEPDGHRRPVSERQAHFDIYAYDRMRILTTELRRIIEDGRPVDLCLKPGCCLTQDQLRIMLPWV